jgi:hypothetical protein
MDILNTALALVSIALGLFGWFAPRYTMEVVDLMPGASAMGPSEIRAASGALFVGLGLGGLVLGSPIAYAMIGFAWGGAAVGRMTSILLDGATPRKWGFFAVEAAVAALLLVINLSLL